MSAEQPAWAHGYDVAELKQIRSVFTHHDGDLPLGAFTRVKENAVAQWAHDGELARVSHGGVVVSRVVRQRQQVKGWNDEPVITLEPGDVHVRRIAWSDDIGEQQVRAWLDRTARALEVDGRVLLVESWAEHEGERGLLGEVLGGWVIGTKIRASSEILSLYALGSPRTVSMPAASELLALGTLATTRIPPSTLQQVRFELEQAGFTWADHYSSYNQRHSWQAVGLTAYTPPGAEPDEQQIVKPTEMNRAWQREHPDGGSWTLQPTRLYEALPWVRGLLEDLLGAQAFERGLYDRARLMLLAPGGGELTRHSDIVDPDVGTGEGKRMRLHLPLATNPDVIFQQWLLDGTRVAMNMPLGQWCYIDTRKPHTARNGGSSERVHLVVDALATPELRHLLLEGRQAGVAGTPISQADERAQPPVLDAGS